MTRALVLVLLAAVGAANAQERPPIVTDRPSESAGTGIVPTGALQLESGYKVESDRAIRERRVDTHTLPDLLTRIGLHRRFEARFIMSGWSIKDRTAGTQYGFNDIGVGLKWRLVEPSGGGPAVSVLGEVDVPVGQDGFTGDFVAPKALLLLDQSLGETTALTVNFGVKVIRERTAETGTRTDTDLPYTALVSHALGDRLGLFAELFGAFALDGRQDRHTLQGGATFALAKRLQLDVRGGAGLVDAAPTWLAGAGLSFRLFR